MLYTALGGPVLGFFYKAVNTMDSMVGYKNERYLHFGRAAAKFDDICNYIPSRISAYLMIAGTYFLGKEYDGKHAYYIYKRDRYHHASPNSAQTEAVCAGALSIQLAGDAWYFGKLVKSRLSEMHCVRWNTRTSEEQTGFCMRLHFYVKAFAFW